MSPLSTDANLPPQVSTALVDLRRGAAALVKLGVSQRQQLLRQCIDGVGQEWEAWAEAAWNSKRINAGTAARAEDIMTGPMPTLRWLWLCHQTLADIAEHGRPQLPAQPRQVRGHLRVPVFPTKRLFDRLLFGPIESQVRMPSGTTNENLFGDRIARASGRLDEMPCVALVLGAGNISSIPITDALTKIFQDNQAVLLKMNPVNEYLGPIFERAFAALVNADLLRIVHGGADVGAALIAADEVDCVHITGSDRTHDAIVWGGDPHEQAKRKAENTPLLQKPITSELGNVSPWIIVPGRYTEKQLRFQAENVVASVKNNASFVCVATKMLITHRDWPQRTQFLKMIDEILANTPARFAYYPGAADRYARLASGGVANADHAGGDDDANGFLPWSFRRGLDISDDPQFFDEESFVCVFGETSLDAATPVEFLSAAVDFANERMWGTLSAALTVPQEFEKQHGDELDACVDRLRYGIVGINQWPGVAFALMSTPWGAYPGATLQDVQSGIGSVHNTFMLDEPEQTVVSSPLTIFPKPMWFSTHRCPEAIARKLIRLYLQPTWWRLPSLLINAMRG